MGMTGSKHQPIEWLLVQPYRPIAAIHLWLHRFSWLHSRHHLVEQLSDKTKRINLVIVLAGWEAQNLEEHPIEWPFV